jgi:hypothetical protein
MNIKRLRNSESKIILFQQNNYWGLTPEGFLGPGKVDFISLV